MKKLNGYEDAQKYTNFEKIPAGGYVLKIINIKPQLKGEDLQPGQEPDALKFQFDIEEGEFKGYFQQNYKEQQQEDKKWKGTIKLWIPGDDDNSQKGNWTMRRFKTAMCDFEESNSGFHWDWDETKLKGKLIGGLFRDKEYNFNGRHGFFTECCGFTTVESIRKGTFKQPGPKYLDGSKNADDEKPDSDGFMPIPDGVKEEIPF